MQPAAQTGAMIFLCALELAFLWCIHTPCLSSLVPLGYLKAAFMVSVSATQLLSLFCEGKKRGTEAIWLIEFVLEHWRREKALAF